MATNTTLGTIRGKIQIDYDGAGVARAITDSDNLEKKAGSTGKAWNNTSKGLLIAGGAIAAGFALSVKSAADFEQGLSNIRAVSGGTEQQMEAVRQKALQLGKDTKFSAGEAAGAIEELSKAGISLPDILNGAADAAVALAAAGEISLPEAATIAANAMNQFGLAAKQLPKVADLIAGAANASAIDVSDFGLALSQVGAVAHLAGLSFDDTAVAIAELGNAGIKGSDAGTSLKTFLQNLIPTTKTQIALSKELGLMTEAGGNAFFDASGKAKSLADISQVLQNALKGMGKEQQLATLQTLFGSDAIRAAAILADGGATGFNNLATAMGKVTANDVAKTKMDNLNGSIEQLKGSVETAGIQIGTTLLPQLKKMVDGVTGAVNAFANLSPNTQKIVIDVLGAVAALALLGGGIIKVVQFFTKLNEAIKIIKALTIWTNIASAATKVWAAAQFLLDLALTPIGLVVIAIIAIIAIVLLAIKYHRQIAAVAIAVWGAIWSFLKKVGSWFAGPFVNFFVGIFNWIKAHWPLLLAILGGPIGAVAAVIITHFSQIKNAVIGFFTAIGHTLLAIYNTLIAPVVNLFAPLFVGAFNLIVAVVRLAWSIITAIIAVAVTLIRAVIGVGLSILSAVWNAFWNALMAVVRPVWAFIVSFVTTQINIVHTVISAVINALVTAWNATWNAVAAVIRAVWGFIGPYVQAAILVAQNAIQAGLNVIQAVVSAVMGVVQKVWSVAWTAVSTTVQAVSNVIVAIIRHVVDFIAGIFNGLTSIVNKFRQFFDQLHAAANGGTGTLIAFISGIPGRILGAIGNLGSALWSKGRDLIQGLINGISSMAGRIRDALVGLLPGPLKKMAGLLGLASPSKLFRKWGIWTVQGFINGISGMVGRLKATMNAVAAVTSAPGSLPGTVAVTGSGGTSDTSTVAPATRRPPPGGGGGPTYVLADFGDGVRQVVRSTVINDPALVATAAAAGNQKRQWAAPGRGGA